MNQTAAHHARKLMQGARFALSVPDAAALPNDAGIEIAFAGRSNTGKSSAINVLCAQRALARTSRTPGRTQHLVVFALDSDRRVVDLPGFGYAKVSKSVRAHWQRALPEYLETRRSLAGLVVVMDVRHPLKENEEVLLNWCARADVAAHVLLNKSDKLSKGRAHHTLDQVSRYLESVGGEASAQLFSAQKRTGMEEAYAAIARWLDMPV